jgi:hypothetical protein
MEINIITTVTTFLQQRMNYNFIHNGKLKWRHPKRAIVQGKGSTLPYYQLDTGQLGLPSFKNLY